MTGRRLFLFTFFCTFSAFVKHCFLLSILNLAEPKWTFNRSEVHWMICNQLLLRACVHTGDFKFVSATYRLFKVPKGQTKTCKVIYNGGITGAQDVFQFDCHYTFKVCIYPTSWRWKDDSRLIARELSKLCQTWLFSTDQPGAGGGRRRSLHPDTFQICRRLHFPATRGLLWALRQTWGRRHT